MEDKRPTIKVSQILEDLNNGLTRYPDSPGYNPDLKSIQEKYGLDRKAVSDLFKTPKLKGKRTQTVAVTPFVLVDDTEEIVEEPVTA